MGDGAALLSYALLDTRAERAGGRTGRYNLGCSRDFFGKHIGPELRWVRRGRLKFVPVAQIEDRLRRNAALTLDSRDQRRFG